MKRVFLCVIALLVLLSNNVYAATSIEQILYDRIEQIRSVVNISHNSNDTDIIPFHGNQIGKIGVGTWWAKCRYDHMQTEVSFCSETEAIVDFFYDLNLYSKDLGVWPWYAKKESAEKALMKASVYRIQYSYRYEYDGDNWNRTGGKIYYVRRSSYNNYIPTVEETELAPVQALILPTRWNQYIKGDEKLLAL